MSKKPTHKALEPRANKRTAELIKANEELKQEIRERKKAEEALQESEERFRTIFEAAEDCIFIKDRNLKYTLVNPCMEHLFKLPASEIIGKTDDELFDDEAGAYIREIDSRVLAGEVIDRKHTKPVDGIPTTFHVIKVPLHNKSGEINGLCGIARNITEIRSLESQLQQSQKMEAIGTLAGGIAHDFNNILFPIMGYAEMMLDDLTEDSPSRDKVNEIIQGTKRASALVKQILAFSRQSIKELKPLKIQLMIKEVLKLIRSSLPSTIEIKQHINDKCGLVMADSAQVHQIAMNLMTNAFHAMEDEGGKLEVTLKEVELGADELTDPSMTPGTYVCLTVADNGSGMDQSVIRRIFEPYFTTKENGKGTGLGLAVVHGIVKSYRGEIRVYSEPGEGTAFHVCLPVIKYQVETEKADAVVPVPKGTERILLVDDEEPIVRMEKQMLERLGYDITERTSSIEALEAFRAAPDKFHLVITDMTMPNMTGIQLSQKLLQIRPDIPIIICTGFSAKVDGEKATAAGIRGYVMKPVVMSEIAKKIREVLDQD